MIQAKIYKIVCDKGDKCYIGSTTKRYLCERWNGHKSDYRHKPNKCASKELFDEYGMDHCRCELIEEVQSETKAEYLTRERYWIENTPNCINIQRKPIASTEEQRTKKIERSKDRYNQKKSDVEFMENRRRMTNEWKEKNKEPILCECGMTYSVQHKARHLNTERHKDKLARIQLENMLAKK